MQEDAQRSQKNGQTRLEYILGVPLAHNVVRQWPLQKRMHGSPFKSSGLAGIGWRRKNSGEANIGRALSWAERNGNHVLGNDLSEANAGVKALRDHIHQGVADGDLDIDTGVGG